MDKYIQNTLNIQANFLINEFKLLSTLIMKVRKVGILLLAVICKNFLTIFVLIRGRLFIGEIDNVS